MLPNAAGSVHPETAVSRTGSGHAERPDVTCGGGAASTYLFRLDFPDLLDPQAVDLRVGTLLLAEPQLLDDLLRARTSATLGEDNLPPVQLHTSREDAIPRHAVLVHSYIAGCDAFDRTILGVYLRSLCQSAGCGRWPGVTYELPRTTSDAANEG
jgi:hypothetical protein